MPITILRACRETGPAYQEKTMNRITIQRLTTVFLLILFIPMNLHALTMRKISDSVDLRGGRYDSLEVRVVDASIEVIPARRNNTVITLTGESNRRLYLDLNTSRGHAEVVVKQRWPRLLSFNTRNRNLRIVVEVPDREFDEMLFKSVSGRIVIKDIRGSAVAASSTSGSVEAANIQVQSLDLKSVSGSVTARNNQAGTYALRTTSGRITLNADRGSVDASSVSGSLTIVLQRLTGDVEARSVSGSVQLNLPTSSDARLSMSTVSGNIRPQVSMESTDFSSRSVQGVIGRGTYAVNVKTTSGAITVSH